MGKMSRTKGHSFERLIAKALRVVFKSARRQLEYQIDDCLGVDLAETGPYRIQCKRFKGYAPISAIEEIKCNEELGDIPVLITQGDHKRILAVIPFEHLIRLFQIEKINS